MERVKIQSKHLNIDLNFKVVSERIMIASTGMNMICLGLAFKTPQGDSLEPLVFHKLFGSDKPEVRAFVKRFNQCLNQWVDVEWFDGEWKNYFENTYIGLEGVASLKERLYNEKLEYQVNRMTKNENAFEPLPRNDHAFGNELPPVSIYDEDIPF
jgi:hypothetical protein